MSMYLCVEDGEKFTVEAKNIEQAKEDASVWNGEVIGIIKGKKVELI